MHYVNQKQEWRLFNVNISISNKSCSFELSIHKKKHSFHKNADNLLFHQKNKLFFLNILKQTTVFYIYNISQYYKCSLGELSSKNMKRSYRLRISFSLFKKKIMHPRVTMWWEADKE